MVALGEELRRVDPGDRGAASTARIDAAISIDTSKLEVARAALDAGATFVNDVTAFRGDPELAALVAERGRRLRADAHAGRAADDAATSPATTMSSARWARSCRERVGVALAAGIDARADHASTRGSASARRRRTTSSCSTACDELAVLGRPILIGTSRKSFLGEADGAPRADGSPARSRPT